MWSFSHSCFWDTRYACVTLLKSEKWHCLKSVVLGTVSWTCVHIPCWIGMLGDDRKIMLSQDLTKKYILLCLSEESVCGSTNLLQSWCGCCECSVILKQSVLPCWSCHYSIRRKTEKCVFWRTWRDSNQFSWINKGNVSLTQKSIWDFPSKYKRIYISYL